MNTDPNAIDSDLAAIPATTPEEKTLIIIEDSERIRHEERQQLAARTTVALEGQASALGKQAAAAEVLAEQMRDKIPPLVFTDEDSLFHSCVFRGVEVRKQSMTTSTTRDGVMQDVIKDGVWIGYHLYNWLARDKGLPLKAIPADL